MQLGLRVPNNSVSNLVDLNNSSELSLTQIYNQRSSAEKSPQLYRNQININNLISICSEKLNKNQHHKKALFIRASSYMKKQRYLQAIEDCHTLLNIDSRNVGAYYLIGCAHEKLDEVEYAIQNFTIVIELDSTHVNALLARGACLNKMGRFKQALEDYEIALKLDS